jgi:hypothetical protein
MLLVTNVTRIFVMLQEISKEVKFKADSRGKAVYSVTMGLNKGNHRYSIPEGAEIHDRHIPKCYVIHSNFL